VPSGMGNIKKISPLFYIYVENNLRRHTPKLKLKDETMVIGVVTTIAALTLSLVIQPANASLALSSLTSI
jgi:hypothetical protein